MLSGRSCPARAWQSLTQSCPLSKRRVAGAGAAIFDPGGLFNDLVRPAEQPEQAPTNLAYQPSVQVPFEQPIIARMFHHSSAADPLI